MRILLIEDNDLIRKALRIGLESESYNVDETSDGEKGSYIARVNDYDAIILDLSLPKKDGLKVCQEIRAAHKKIPIIMLSVTNDPETKARLLNAGADDYLSKPFSYPELYARLRALMRRPQTFIPHVMNAGEISLDSVRHVVTYRNKPVYLTRKEFSLLEYMMRNPNVVLTRGMIMEHVWDDEVDPFSNTIEAHILNLRRKVDVQKNSRSIKTIPGRGYKFETVIQPA